MPRTAKTLALTHDGKEILLAGKTVNLLEQKELLKKIRGERHHPKYAEVSYQESDGPEQVYRFLTPKAHQERQDQIAADTEAQAKFAAEDAARIARENGIPAA